MSTFDDLLANQQQTLSGIEQVWTNFNKDGPDRKTLEYLQRRLDTLEKYWAEFQNNHFRMTEVGGESHTYFSNNEYQRARERYDYIRSHIQSLLAPERPKTPISIIKPPTFGGKSSEPQLPGPSSKSMGSVSKTDENLRKQQSNFRAFHRTISNIEIDSISEQWEFDDILRTLQARWNAIDALHWDLDSELDGRNKEYEDTFSVYEKKYADIKKALNRKMSSVAHMEKYTPKMEIPIFHGNYNSWTSFKDLFTEIIHNNPTMSPAQKMQYLKSKVKGEAERLIQHLHVSSDNYNVCWDILNQRFNNKKLLFTSHINIILNLPVMQQQSLNHIKRIHDTALECLNAIKNLGIDISTWDPLIVHLLAQKMDADSYADYIESVKQPRELPVLAEFMNFLETKFTTLESSRRKQDNQAQKSQSVAPVHHNNIKQKSGFYKSSFTSSAKMNPKDKVITTKYRCSFCKDNDHGIYFCRKFLDLPSSNKYKMVEALELCKNCLNKHQGKPCLSERRCRDCNKEHNSLLHAAFEQVDQAASTSAGTRTSAGSAASKSADSNTLMKSSSHVSLPNDESEVLLPTAIIKIQAADGSFKTMRALLDQGSQTSLITEHAAQVLKLIRKRCKGVISGVGDKESSCKGMIQIKCSSIVNDFTFETNAIIMKSLIKNLPSTTFAKPSWSYLDNINLADSEYYISRPVDLLLGADVYSTLLLDGICRVDEALPIAQQTKLGWILSGHTKTFQCNVVLHNLEEIERFWQVEEISEPSDMSSEDQKCIEYYKDTTVRKEDGHYEVRVPFKPNYQEDLGLSRNKALAQFYHLEHKLNKQENISRDYKVFINEYLTLGHMILEGNDRNKRLECYLPHHCVTRQESTTTKLRVVFNASAKTSSGLSLNEVMCRGPNLQQDLQCLVIKWRQFKFAFTADIEKMFRQIWLHEEDQMLHKIIWRDNPSEKLQVFQLTTVTYGTKAAPFLAMMTLKQLAEDERANYQDSSAAEVLEQSFYMDDLIHGAHSAGAAQQLKHDLVNLLKSGGFNLRKWKSNLPELLDEKENGQDIFDFKQAESSSGKTLGLRWNPQKDCFTFKSQMEVTLQKATKRALLSEISKLFDPLGWIVPVTSKLKILFQDVWRANIDWDENVPQDLHQQWTKITADIQSIEECHVPRWLGIEEGDNIELHGFCDASTKCYACVVYCKIKKKDSESIILVAGKAKLVPLNKIISLPRLELCSATLLAKLMSKIKQCLASYNLTVYGWSDSMAALGWLHGEAERWKPFVANRVRQITKEIPPQSWRYVKSKENPADCASRGLTASELKKHDLWWHGPTWLPTYEATNTEPIYSTDQEQKKKTVCTTQVSSTNGVVNTLLTRTSSLIKVINITAWVLRFIHKGKYQNYLSVKERRRARTVIIKQVQQEEFHEEINCLKANKMVKSNSKLNQLSPILDEDGVVRVGGRLRYANIDLETKHPAIIPKNTRLGDLIIDEAHVCTYHGGARLTTAFTRRQYWIIGGIKTTKKRLRHCVTCRKQNPEQQYQLMGDLPAARVNQSRPFYHTGVDYTGHVLIKANKGRGIKTTKGYVAVFVCMATKAVHLELVSDLTSSAFLAALRRMAARRGVPGHIYSDQGRNFIGADRILQQEYEELDKIINTEFLSEVASMSIEWHFNAPAWPSAGGLWESSVKSLKHHLKRVIGEQKLTFEEFSTLLSQLEGCLNSRPLVALTEDASDVDVITPSHFLASGPALNILETETDMRTRWYQTQKIFQDIWGRWQNEYLTQLSVRGKWQKPQPNIKENDIVVIRDENLPPGKWALGRVVQLHPGNDGYVRVVTLKTKNGFIQRPIVKLSILPVNKDNEEVKETSKQEDRKSTTSHRKRKTYCLATLATRLLLFFMTIIPTVEGSYRMTPLENNSLHFDSITNMHVIRDEWRLVVYYDTLPYQEGNTTLNKYINYLDGLCNRINAQSHCNEIILQLRHECNELRYYDNILLQKKHNLRTRRRRRGLINGVGYIANSLFGVLDAHFAEQYKQDIDLIKTNQRHLASLWRNQTSIVEAEFNVLKRTEIIMDRHHKMINSRMNEVEHAINQVNSALQNVTLENEFISTAMMANNLLLSLKNVQQTLLDTVTNIYNGKFNFHLLTPDQLKQELNVISGLIPRDLTLPIDNYDLSKMYNLLQVRARVTEGYVIFEIKIPLIARDRLEISKIIPVPYKVDDVNENVIVPISEYAGINVNKDAFIPLTENDLNSCTRRDENTVLCHLKMPIYQIKDDRSFCEKLPNSRRCKIITSACHNRWIELNKFNIYFYFCCQQCQLKLLCNDQVTSVQMTRAGLLSVEQGCTIKTADFFVYSHRREISNLSISSQILAPEISAINQIYNFSIPEHFMADKTESNQNMLELSKIQQHLEILQKTEPISEGVSSHDVHHYVAIYILVGAAAAGAAVLAWKRCRHSAAAAAEAPGAPLPAARSLSNIPCSVVNSDSARVLRENRSTSPVLRSIF